METKFDMIKAFFGSLVGLEPLSHAKETFLPDRDAVLCATNLNCDKCGEMH